MPVRRLLAIALTTVALLTLATAGARAAASGMNVVWSSQTYQLDVGGTMQATIGFREIPVRSWQLVVESGSSLIDLTVTRSLDGSLLYQKYRESRHEVAVPWGVGEELRVDLKLGEGLKAQVESRLAVGAVTISLLGPPRERASHAYSYSVNRALEAYAAGDRASAETHCRDALRRDPHDGVAKVLLAGLLRDAGEVRTAAGMLEQVLADSVANDSLTDDVREMAARMQAELAAGPAAATGPPDENPTLITVRQVLERGDATEALTRVDAWLGGGKGSSAERGAALTLRGRALLALDRHFEAVDSLTQALALTGDRASQAVIYFRLGEVYLAMQNPQQAETALAAARRFGSPSGLDVQARDALREIARNQY